MTTEEIEQAKLHALEGILHNTQNTAELLARLLLLMEAATGFREIPEEQARPSGLIIPPGAKIPGDERTCRLCGATEFGVGYLGRTWIEEDLCTDCAPKLPPSDLST